MKSRWKHERLRAYRLVYQFELIPSFLNNTGETGESVALQCMLNCCFITVKVLIFVSSLHI